MITLRKSFRVLGDRSGRVRSVVMFGVVVAAVAFLAVRSGIVKQVIPPEPVNPPAVDVKVKEQTPDSAGSWKTFVSSLKKRCADEGADCTVAYDSLYQHDKDSYGVLVLAWKDSEYEVELFRFDRSALGWVEAPMVEMEMITQVDVAGASKKWGVPEAALNGWLEEARKAMQTKYGEVRE